MKNKNRLQVQLIQVFAAERCITSHSDPFKWFIENKAVIRNDLTKAGIRIDAFELWLRWQSPMGQDCTKAIIRYIRERQELTIEESNKRYAKKPIEDREILFAVIDFSDFSFLHQDSILTLEDFYRAHYTSSRLYGSTDLRGIDLSGIRMDNCVLQNIAFSEACLQKWHVNQSIFSDCNFVSSDLSQSRFVSIQLRGGTTFSSCDFSSTFLNAIEFPADSLGNYVHINQISYFELLGLSLKVFRKLGLNYEVVRNKTVFSLISIQDSSKPELSELIEYVRWFQGTYRKLNSWKSLSFAQRLWFLLELVTTKNWMSPAVLFNFSLSLILIFALIYNVWNIHFRGLSQYFLDSLYYSIVTFTTLGYGDIVPITFPAKAIVSCEVLAGYLVLGLFVFMLGRKVNNRY